MYLFVISSLQGNVLDIGVMLMNKTLFLLSTPWSGGRLRTVTTASLCICVEVFLSDSVCHLLQRMETTLLCPSMQLHQNLTTVTCSKENLLRAVKGSKSLRNARKYLPATKTKYKKTPEHLL